MNGTSRSLASWAHSIGLSLRAVLTERSLLGANASRRAVIKWVIGVTSCACLLIYAFITKDTLSRAFQFRGHPSQSEAHDILAGDWPHDVLAKWILFRPGTRAYTQDFRSWVYSPDSVLSDTIWNRWLVASDVKRMSQEDRSTYLDYYPVHMTAAVLQIVQSDITSGHLEALGWLRFGSTEARNICAQWANSHLANSGDTDVFLHTDAYLVECSVPTVDKLFSRFWPMLSDEDRDQMLEDVAQTLWSSDSRVNPETAESVFHWFSEGVAQGHIGKYPNSKQLVTAFLSRDEQCDRTLSLLSSVDFTSQDLASVLDSLSDNKSLMALSDLVFDRAQGGRPDLAAEAFSRIAQAELAEAEELARPLLSAPDSELRKGVIVELVKSGSALGNEHLDEAFSGSAPRRRMFERTVDYTQTSKAAQLYRTLSRHDYLETGKTWPPAKKKGSPPDDVGGWRQFITQYPWFPGTDDAYYRLAYTQYNSGRLPEALHTAEEYFSVELPDHDSDPYLVYLVNRIAFDNRQAGMHDPLLSHMREFYSHSVGAMMFQSHPDIDPVIGSLDWFLANKKMIPLLGLNEQDVVNMRTVAEIIKTRNVDDRFERASTSLQSQEQGIARLLYPDPCIAITLEHKTRADCPGFALLESTGKAFVDHLSMITRDTSCNEACRGAIDWAFLHYTWSHEALSPASAPKIAHLLGLIRLETLPQSFRDKYATHEKNGRWSLVE